MLSTLCRNLFHKFLQISRKLSTFCNLPGVPFKLTELCCFELSVDPFLLKIFVLRNFRLGELNGVKYSSELSAADCFELGRQSYNNGDFYHTQLWMEEADKRLKREAKNETVDESEVLEYLAFSIYKQGKGTKTYLDYKII